MIEPAQLPNTDNILSLKQAASLLRVSVETLIEWNDNNILKPTITSTGEVVYKKEQVEKFMAIQKINQVPTISSAAQEIPAPYPSYQIERKVSLQDKNLGSQTKSEKSRFFAVGGISFVVTLSISLLAIFFFHQRSSNPNVPSPSQHSEHLVSENTQSTGGVALIKTPSQNIPLTNKNVENNIEENTNTKNKLGDDFLSSDNQDATTAASVDNKLPLPPVLGLDTNNPTSNFASRPNTENNNSVFDEEGNIKEEVATKDPLAINLATNNLTTNNSTLKQTLFPTLLAIGLLLIVIGFATQPSFAEQNNSLNTSLQTSVSKPPINKVLEVNQKADGTVVLCFQGGEHKICKPELNSETDQFIQRLLGFAKDNVKEINYNILKDEKVSLNAPLSKLVTRLGFVGLKRDLFFPRTSKNRVIFRKYLTDKDLVSLNLSPDKISRELLN